MATAIHNKYILNNQAKDTSDFVGNHPDDIVLYEVVRLIDGKILFLDDHINRFFKSLHYTALKNVYSKEELINQLGFLIQINQITIGNIRFELVINHTNKEQNFLAYFIPHAYPTEEQYKNGVSVAITQALRDNPNAKRQHSTLAEKINQIIAKEKAYEAIMIHPNGYVTEGSRSNIFMIKDNTIFTAPEKDILPGITRKYILQVCDNLQFKCQEKRIIQSELFSMEALFITGTSPKVLPIRTIGDKQFDVNHPMLRLIMKGFDLLLISLLENSPKFLAD